MRHEARPINSQGWSIAIAFAIGVLVLWAVVYWFHHTHYRSYRDTEAAAGGPPPAMVAPAPIAA